VSVAHPGAAERRQLQAINQPLDRLKVSLSLSVRAHLPQDYHKKRGGTLKVIDVLTNIAE
ncbi:MAG: hypothetical protein V2I33_17695, partial [Kangiellaceae bacterium]|jgi:hypothetical protein|nr:hypothetical protein [Kangiellaceae bacterium]